MVVLDELEPQALYRFFDHEWQAEALAAGRVWISTLDACRRYEDAERGDPEEATVVYNSGIAFGDSDHPGVELIARRSGVHLAARVTNMVIAQNMRAEALVNSYVLCATEDPSSEVKSAFGQYGVRIDSPWSFFRMVTRVLQKRVALRRAMFGGVTYALREFEGLSDAPGRLGFVKPPDKYAKQREVRMLWVPQDPAGQLTPFELECSDARKFCVRIS